MLRRAFKILTEDNQELTETFQILEEQRTFYSKLYGKDQNVNFSLKNSYDIKVPEDIEVQQDQQISMVEIHTAIKAMSNDKTPGQDGIPIDFYKVFWTRISTLFFDMVMQCFDLKHLHASARKGILNLIPKANKDTRLIKNLRPITLLNTDYKIIEKVIANKMLPGIGAYN